MYRKSCKVTRPIDCKQKDDKIEAHGQSIDGEEGARDGSSYVKGQAAGAGGGGGLRTYTQTWHKVMPSNHLCVFTHTPNSQKVSFT
jgi:hypothetical protein